jgi:hypothetical protein
VDFQQFLNYFPAVELPITLREDTYEELSADMPIIPQAMIDHFLMDEADFDDDMTEYIPCFRLPKHEHFDAVVYWKASLLSYDYILKTYTKDGEGVIDSQTIAGTQVKDGQIIQSIAIVGADDTIYIATGNINDDGTIADATQNSTRTIEINEDGTLE